MVENKSIIGPVNKLEDQTKRRKKPASEKDLAVFKEHLARARQIENQLQTAAEERALVKIVVNGFLKARQMTNEEISAISSF